MSDSQKSARRLDTERLIVVPALVVLLLVSIAHLWGSQGASGPAHGLTMVQHTLTVLFYVLMVALLLTRKQSRGSTRSWRATVAAYVGSFAPFLLLLNGRSRVTSPGITVVSIVVITLGLAFSIYSLAWLGRSFGVVPQARDLVRSGPYSFVRHPLYVGEIVSFGGAVVGVLTFYSASILLLLVLVQAYRAAQEEKVLEASFPDYGWYKAQTGRFTPRLTRPATVGSSSAVGAE